MPNRRVPSVHAVRRLRAAGFAVAAVLLLAGCDSAPTWVRPAKPGTAGGSGQTAPGAVTHHDAYVKALDITGHTATVQLVSYLTGSAMKKACAADHRKAVAETCTDYYIRGLSTAYVHMKLSKTAKATLIDVGKPTGSCTKLSAGMTTCKATLAELRSALTTAGASTPVLVTLTERDGVIVALDQIFVP